MEFSSIFFCEEQLANAVLTPHCVPQHKVTRLLFLFFIAVLLKCQGRLELLLFALVESKSLIVDKPNLLLHLCFFSPRPILNTKSVSGLTFNKPVVCDPNCRRPWALCVLDPVPV